MKRKILFGLALLFSLCATNAMAQGNGNTYQDGYTRGYAFGRSNTVASVQNFTTQYMRAVEGDEVGYAQGMADGFVAGVDAGPLGGPQVTFTYAGGGGTVNEADFPDWLAGLVEQWSPTPPPGVDVVKIQ